MQAWTLDLDPLKTVYTSVYAQIMKDLLASYKCALMMCVCECTETVLYGHVRVRMCSNAFYLGACLSLEIYTDL